MNDTVLSSYPFPLVAPRMRALGVCALLLALSVGCQGYGSYRTGYRSSSSSSFGAGRPQALNNWAYSHLNEVREFANRLTQVYNAMSAGAVASFQHAIAWSGKYHPGLSDLNSYRDLNEKKRENCKLT